MASKPTKPTKRKNRKEVPLRQKYQKLDEYEHIKHRPDTFIGSCTASDRKVLVYTHDHGLELKTVLFVEGLVSLFDEPLVNVGDHKTRHPNQTTYLNVEMDTHTIRFKNNGPGIPVEIHPEYNQYVPEMIFGSLRTSSNYDDSDTDSIAGGRNGYGVKLTNIFSNSFVLQTVNDGKKFTMKWTNHMETKSSPQIQTTKQSPYTQIEFQPDMSLFGNISLESMHPLFAKRLLDLAGTCPNITVKLNGTKMPVRGFKDYCTYVARALGTTTPVGYIAHPRWEIGIAASPHGEAVNISFVNHISTDDHGTHVNYVRSFVEKELRIQLEKQLKTTIQPSKIRNNLLIFVNAFITKPSFSSQTKTKLMTDSSKFGSKHGLTSSLLAKMVRHANLMEIIIERSRTTLHQLSKTTKSKTVREDKLRDANWAGTKRSHKCRLILTEGDSAATLAISGREKAGGPNINGIYPLRGKLFNPCASNHSLNIVAQKKELNAITRILNLKPKPFDYHNASNRTSLRYGQLVIMVDQDKDGAHIEGLIMNFLNFYNPSILGVPGFLCQFITPVLKARKGNKCVSFFSEQAYAKWTQTHALAPTYTTKYYKGLGSSSTAEAKQYFSNLNTHLLEFEPLTKTASKLISRAFCGDQVAQRKEWMLTCGGSHTHTPDFETRPLTYDGFFASSFMEYNNATITRAIPSVLDGFKEAQRKIVYGMLKRNITKETKVAQVASSIDELTFYHHGEKSLQDTLIGMTQSFVGKNNLALFSQGGQFGSRLQGGDDAASARYVFVKLAKLTRRIFPEADDAVLEYLTEEGQSIEPRVYAPIIPMILVNGAKGIATGWSTEVCMYNPQEIVGHLLDRIHKPHNQVRELKPWYRGFTGTITSLPTKYKTQGVYTFTKPNQVHITELPIKTWTAPYVDKLHLLKESKAKHSLTCVTHVQDNSSDTQVDIRVTLRPSSYAKYVQNHDQFETDFGLVGYLNRRNMHLLDVNSTIKKYTVPEIVDEFTQFRLAMYAKRKTHQLQQYEDQLTFLAHKVRFVQAVLAETIQLRNVSKSKTIAAMVQHDIPESLHDKFLSMPLSSLHTQRVKELVNLRTRTTQAKHQLAQLTLVELWSQELNALLEVL